MDSESGGAKGHYPNSRTRQRLAGSRPLENFFRILYSAATARLGGGFREAKETFIVPKPPQTPPSSDLDGVNEDEVRNIDAANEAGQSASDLARARDEAMGRPKPSREEGADDRSR